MSKAKDFYEKAPETFDYGPLNFLAEFKDSHPAVMKSMIEKFNWSDKLQYLGKPNKYREPHKHEKIIIRFLSFVEKYLRGGKQIGGFINYILLDK